MAGDFECRHPDWHGDDDWHPVTASCAASAVEQYVEDVDSRDCEAFQRPDTVETFLVREAGKPDTVRSFNVSFDYFKHFRVRAAREAS
jgi:hypothetical protein